jgi:hypothetical protein
MKVEKQKERRMRYEEFQKSLRQSAANWFDQKGFQVREGYPYILSQPKRWNENIIVSAVADLIKQEKNARNDPFPLHRWLHHGLSSQAMLFNLFGPLVNDNLLGLLRIPFEKAGIVWPEDSLTGEFEYQDRLIFNELQVQPTSLDFVLKNALNQPLILIEAKLSEKDFGLCSGLKNGQCGGLNPLKSNLKEVCYHSKIGREYWQVFENQKILREHAKISPSCPMALFYQFYREVGFAAKAGAEMVFLVDKRNPYFDRNSPCSLITKLLDSLRPATRKFVKVITIQDIITGSEEQTAQLSWIKEFKNKYGIV